MALPETTQLLERLGVAVNEQHRRRRRQRIAILAASALLAVSGGALAAATQAPWWESGTPPVDPSAVVAVARDNLPANVDAGRARTVAESEDAALVAVPLDETGYCLIPSLGGRADIGAQCVYQVVNPERGDSDLLAGYARPAAKGTAGTWIVYGRITDPRAAHVELGALTVRLRPGGFFLAPVPKDRWQALGGRATRGRVLDASGATLRTGCVNWGPSPESSAAAPGKVRLWSDGSGPCTPQPSFGPPILDLGRAEKLVELRLAFDFSIWKAGATIALWRGEAEDGRVCVWVAAASPAPAGTSQGLPGGPGSCGSERPLPDGRPFGSVSFSVGPGGLIIGRIGPRSGIARVVLRSGSGATVLPFRQGWFLGQLPEGGVEGKLPPGGPFVLVGYDRSRREIASESLDEIRARATPR